MVYLVWLQLGVEWSTHSESFHRRINTRDPIQPSSKCHCLLLPVQGKFAVFHTVFPLPLRSHGRSVVRMCLPRAEDADRSRLVAATETRQTCHDIQSTNRTRIAGSPLAPFAASPIAPNRLERNVHRESRPPGTAGSWGRPKGLDMILGSAGTNSQRPSGRRAFVLGPTHSGIRGRAYGIFSVLGRQQSSCRGLCGYDTTEAHRATGICVTWSMIIRAFAMHEDSAGANTA